MPVLSYREAVAQAPPGRLPSQPPAHPAAANAWVTRGEWLLDKIGVIMEIGGWLTLSGNCLGV